MWPLCLATPEAGPITPCSVTFRASTCVQSTWPVWAAVSAAHSALSLAELIQKVLHGPGRHGGCGPRPPHLWPHRGLLATWRCGLLRVEGQPGQAFSKDWPEPLLTGRVICRQPRCDVEGGRAGSHLNREGSLCICPEKCWHALTERPGDAASVLESCALFLGAASSWRSVSTSLSASAQHLVLKQLLRGCFAGCRALVQVGGPRAHFCRPPSRTCLTECHFMSLQGLQGGLAWWAA